MRTLKQAAVASFAILAGCEVSQATIITVEYTGTYTASWSGNYDPTNFSIPSGGFGSGTFAGDFSLTFSFDTLLATQITGSSLSSTPPCCFFPPFGYTSAGSAVFQSSLISVYASGYSASDVAQNGMTSQSVSGLSVSKAGFSINPIINISASSPDIQASILAPLLITNGLAGSGHISYGYSFAPAGGGSLGISLSPTTLEVSISPIADAVPEPSTWAMLLIGFAGIGFAAYKQRTKVARPESI